MKTFASTASRIRSYARIVRAGTLVCLVLSVAWLALALFKPNPAVEVNGPTQRRNMAMADDAQRSQWLNVLETRPFRPVVVAPPAPAKPLAPPKVVVAPNIEIVATMVNPGQTPRAFVRSKTGGGKLVSVQPGKLVDGATVKEIVEGQVTVEVEGHEFVIKVGRKPS